MSPTPKDRSEGSPSWERFSQRRARVLSFSASILLITVSAGRVVVVSGVSLFVRCVGEGWRLQDAHPPASTQNMKIPKKEGVQNLIFSARFGFYLEELFPGEVLARWRTRVARLGLPWGLLFLSI